MTQPTSRRYTLRSTAELDELIETRRVELENDLTARIQHTYDITSVYATRDLIARGVLNVIGGVAELAPVTGATTHTIALYIPRVFDETFDEIAALHELTTHATLRALIVAGASS
jgi:hypothetical protein